MSSIAIVAFAVVAGACSSSHDFSTTTSTAGAVEGKSSFTAVLRALPDGAMQLVERGQSAARVRLNAFGLTPTSRVSVELHSGTCLAPSDEPALTFGTLGVNGAGRINATFNAPEPAPSPLPEPAYLAVFASDDVASAPFAIACTDLDPQNPTQAGRLFPASSERPSGTATVAFDPSPRTVRVSVSVTGMPASSVHEAEMRTGRCTERHPIQYRLKDLTSSRQTRAAATTVIRKHVVAPRADWSIVVRSSRSDGPDRPLLCGDLAPA